MTVNEAFKDNPKNTETPKDYISKISKLTGKSEGYVKKKYYEKPTGKPKIQGITAKDDTDFEKEILPTLKNLGRKALAKTEKEEEAKIEVDSDRPFAVAVMSDVHGGAKADYDAIDNDLKIIDQTQDLWAILAGDLTDNFIIGKLQNIQKEQPTPFAYETRFVRWFIEKIKPSLIAFVSGNHDNWTKKVAAYDHLKLMLEDVQTLFDSNQVKFTLKYGESEQKWLVRHKFKNGSIFNSTHGHEVAWERLGIDFDVAVAGHTHIATLCRPFIKHDKKRFALLLGTYKLRDEFATELGFAKSYGRGSGAFVYHPDGRPPVWCDDLKTARDLLFTYKIQT